MIYFVYIFYILISSSGWIFINMNARFPMQTEFSIFYRQLFAAVLSLLGVIILRQRMKLTKEELLFGIIIGFLVVFLGCATAYHASKVLISGFVCCIGATSVIMSEVLLSIINKRKPSYLKLFLGLLGVVGVGMLMHKSLFSSQVGMLNTKVLFGTIIAVCSTFTTVASSAIIEKYSTLYKKIPKMTFMLTTYLSGCVALLIVGLIQTRGAVPTIPTDYKYVMSLSYLSFFSSFVSFGCIYYLADAIGAVGLSYSAIIAPVIAMLISSIFEPFTWDAISIFGILILVISVCVGLSLDSNKKV